MMDSEGHQSAPQHTQVEICDQDFVTEQPEWHHTGMPCRASQSIVLESCMYEDEQPCPANHRPGPIIPAPAPVISINPTMSPLLGLEVSTPSAHPDSLIGSVCGPSGLAWDRSLDCTDHDLVSAAAHLHLLGESLSLIGHHLQETNKSVCMSRSLFLLLDSLLCALPPLICLTSQVPELKSCIEHTLASTLENIAYVMPGL